MSDEHGFPTLRSLRTQLRLMKVALVAVLALQFLGNSGVVIAAPASLAQRVRLLERSVRSLETLTSAQAAVITQQQSDVTSLKALLAPVSRIGTDFIFTAVNVHVRSGSGSTNAAPNGLGNLVVGYNELRDESQVRTGSHNLVVGSFHNYSSYGGLVAGEDNTISGPFASVSGGASNVASRDHASVSGGFVNWASAPGATVSGGSANRASGDYASVGGGQQNTANAPFASVSGGVFNLASGGHSSVSGGYQNVASAPSSSVSGGTLNVASGIFASVSGGGTRTASGASNWAAGGLLQSE